MQMFHCDAPSSTSSFHWVGRSSDFVLRSLPSITVEAVTELAVLAVADVDGRADPAGRATLETEQAVGTRARTSMWNVVQVKNTRRQRSRLATASRWLVGRTWHASFASTQLSERLAPGWLCRPAAGVRGYARMHALGLLCRGACAVARPQLLYTRTSLLKQPACARIMFARTLCWDHRAHAPCTCMSDCLACL